MARTRNTTAPKRPKGKKGNALLYTSGLYPPNHPVPLALMALPPTGEAYDNPETLTIHQRRYLRAYAITGNGVRACLASGITRMAVHNWGKGRNAAEYLEAFGHAQAEANARIEMECHRRAVEGVLVRKFHPKTGEEYWEHQYSDFLLKVLLDATNPAKYRAKYEHSHKHSGKDGGAINHQHTHVNMADVLKLLPLDTKRQILAAIRQKQITDGTIVEPLPLIGGAVGAEVVVVEENINEEPDAGIEEEILEHNPTA